MNYEKHSNRKKQEAIHSVSKKTTKKVGITLIKVFVFACLLFMVVGLASGLGIAKAIIDSAPALDIGDVTPEGYATIIYDQNGNDVQQLHGDEANRIYAEMDQIPKYMQDAVVAIEDERFWKHNGIDMQGIFRAIFKNLKEGDPTASGASTLTQQVIKNNVLSTEKKFERKIQEQYLAIQLEKQMTKEKILELYLNTSSFGRGTLGVQTAAKTYFNKDVSALTIAESAVIASITQLPTYYDPIAHPDHNRDKQVIVLKKMLEQKYITQEQYETAMNEDVYSHIQVVSEDIAVQSDYSYFVDEVIREVSEDLKVEKGYTENQALQLIYRGGLSIYITQDSKMQQIMDNVFSNEELFPPQDEAYAMKVMYTLSVQGAESVENHYDEAEFDTKEEADAHIEELKAVWVTEGQQIIAEKALFIPQPQAAMVIMDYHTGHVKALTGGRGQKIGNQTFNRATQAERQPGSTFKILAAYLPAIDTGGYTLATAIDDVPFEITSPNGTSYAPGNWYRKQAFNFRG
ncbi:MAG: transglycosylase domain-containing protein, partial [Vallitaleaceae bacterium]|nr:transglycosylase domain-containing protein [Vallitaleaceae bacterium]